MLPVCMCVGRDGHGVVWTEAVKGLIPGSNGEKDLARVCKAGQGWSVQRPWSTRSGVGGGLETWTPDY